MYYDRMGFIGVINIYMYETLHIKIIVRINFEVVGSWGEEGFNMKSIISFDSILSLVNSTLKDAFFIKTPYEKYMDFICFNSCDKLQKTFHFAMSLHCSIHSSIAGPD